MDHLKKGLIEVRKNIYLSKDHPDFYEKFLKFQPNHKESLYEYAKELFEQGKVVDAVKRLEKAKALGHYKADRLLKEWNGTHSYKAPNNESPWKRTLLWMALITCVLCLLLLFLPYFINNFWFEENNYYYSKTNHVVSAQDKTKDSDLPNLLFLNGVERYKEITGKYPSSESDLLLSKDQPNTLSSIPPEHYLFSGSPLEVSVEGKMFKGGVPADYTLELHFYPEVNQLALVRGNGEVLSTYPVASGKAPLLFTKSTISERVVEPNGGKKALGIRGLVLEDNYAIHGTDNPFSIGSRSTNGCIRLFNDHIEELYPYVSLGTPFYVKKGEPTSATFQEGLPSIPLTIQQLASETQPNRTFQWKQ
jgi:L,D-transpeptidase catalytic domain